VSERLGLGGEPIDGGPLNWTNWVAGVTSVYASLFGVGRIVLGSPGSGVALLGLAALCFVWIARNLRPERWSVPEGQGQA